MLHRLQTVHDPFSQLPENRPHGLRDVLLQGLVHARLGTGRLFGLCWLRLRDALRSVWLLRGLRGALQALWLLRGLWGALLSVWPLVLVHLRHRLVQLGGHPALLVNDRGRGCVAPLPHFSVFLVRLLRWCQHQAFQTGKTLPQLVLVLLQFPFPGVLLQFPAPSV
jgi:hypothetical protein